MNQINKIEKTNSEVGVALGPELAFISQKRKSTSFLSSWILVITISLFSIATALAENSIYNTKGDKLISADHKETVKTSDGIIDFGERTKVIEVNADYQSYTLANGYSYEGVKFLASIKANPGPISQSILFNVKQINNGIDAISSQEKENFYPSYSKNILPPGDCITGCNTNTFLNSDDPNSLEYDNIVGLYHSSMLKETNNDLLVWGASASPTGSSQLSPISVKPANGYTYTGNILKFTGGSANGSNAQFTILTDNGLYFWGTQAILVNSNVKSGSSFGKANALGTSGETETSTYSLPMGVLPADVKMMYGTYQTLVIVTCSGEAWVLSQNRYLYGDGITSSSSSHQYEWHRVSTASSTPLTNVVAVRGTTTALMALTSNGNIYTWGRSLYLGNNSGTTNQTYAVAMTKPSGTIKQIGMTGANSYYALNRAGELYSLGENGNRELGIFSTTDQRNWVRVLQNSSGSGTPLPAIAWISPNEHSSTSTSGTGGYAAINAITTAGELWSWGENHYNMLGSGSGATNPTSMVGGLDPNDRIMAVETGGHTSMVIRQCSFKYGYLGHKTNGSMGDGTSGSGQVTNFNFEDTGDVSLCGAPTAPVVKDIEVCSGTTGMDLNNALVVNDFPSGYTLEWWTTIDRISGTEVPDPANVAVGTYYAFIIPNVGNCANPVPSKVEVKYSNIQLELLKSAVLIDADNNGISNVGDYITYTFTINNTGDTAVENLELNDAQIGVINQPITPSTLAPGGPEIIVSFDYYLTASDITNKSVYNLADINGQTDLGCIATQTSLDPDPLNPGEDGYDPTRPDHTYIPLITDLICTEPVDGEAFQWSETGGASGSTVSRTITQPGANGGFVFDIYELDNSFNMEINGVKLAQYEIEFQSNGTPAPGINIEFADGDQYETNTGGDIWEMTGTTSRPLIRVNISAAGVVSMSGSKTSGGVLFPLQFKQGITPVNYFNTINWNATSNNTIIVTQNVVGATKMNGLGSGKNIVPCNTYTLTKEGVFNDENGDGIAQVGETITYTLKVKNAEDIDIYNLKVVDPMLDGEIIVAPTGDTNSDGVLNIYEEWVYTVIYPVTQQDINKKGVYNLATVSGKNILDEDLDPETSIDPTPLETGNPNYDPLKPDHTFVPLKGPSRLITNPHIYQKVKRN